MLSICIPIYNQNITQLVNDLHSQAESLNTDYEILLIDDCSSALEVKETNKKLAGLSHTTYKELPKNIGRSAIRNLLAKETTFNHILFIDCDAEVCSDTFLKTYLPECKPNIVCCGGCAYSKTPPSPDRYLRWYIGTKREDRPVSDRVKSAAAQFTAFNLLIDKSLILACPFDERITQYGHEDTLLGIELQKLNANFSHIDNPLIHAGIDETTIFLEKTDLAIKSLVTIQELFENDSFTDAVRILRTYDKLNSYKLIPILNFLLPKAKDFFIRNLKSQKPKLLYFDLYKLCCLLKYKN